MRPQRSLVLRPRIACNRLRRLQMSGLNSPKPESASSVDLCRNQLVDTLPLLGSNATVNPLDDYSYTPPYTPPHISLLLPHYTIIPRSPLHSTPYITTISPLYDYS